MSRTQQCCIRRLALGLRWAAYRDKERGKTVVARQQACPERVCRRLHGAYMTPWGAQKRQRELAVPNLLTPVLIGAGERN